MKAEGKKIQKEKIKKGVILVIISSRIYPLGHEQMSMHEHTCSYTFHVLIKSPPILTGSVRWKNPLLLRNF
jgi:hypothetical protein